VSNVQGCKVDRWTPHPSPLAEIQMQQISSQIAPLSAAQTNSAHNNNYV